MSSAMIDKAVSRYRVIELLGGGGMGVAVIAAAFQGLAAMQSELPRLKYDAPEQLLHSALRPPEVYESTLVNASIHVYSFRPA